MGLLWSVGRLVGSVLRLLSPCADAVVSLDLKSTLAERHRDSESWTYHLRDIVFVG